MLLAHSKDGTLRKLSRVCGKLPAGIKGEAVLKNELNLCAKCADNNDQFFPFFVVYTKHEYFSAKIS